MTKQHFSSSVNTRLICPCCGGRLELCEEDAKCANGSCKSSFPVMEGVPILINEGRSVFSLSDFTERRDTYFRQKQNSRFKNALIRAVPSLSKNLRARENYRRLGNILLSSHKAPVVLVLGGSILGEGIEILLECKGIELVETDVSFGPRTSLICDAEDIPFMENTFDAVIVQAVLEHIVDPYRSVQEIHRVLKENGLVYAETPFMQQVHGGRYDFTRFTHLGHRRLFRYFEEIDSGVVCGPGMALAWSYEYFLLSFVKSSRARKIVQLVARISAFYLKYFDYLLHRRPGALDAASGVFFLGRKSMTPLADKALVEMYRGCV